MRQYIDNLGKAIPNVIQMGLSDEYISSEESLMFYGFFNLTGMRGFFRKLRIGIIARCLKK